MAERRLPPAACANCGAAIPPTARACPDCGADERTGWREASIYDGLDLPDEAVDLGDGGVPDGKPGRTSARLNGVPWYWWVVGVVLLVCLILAFLGLR